MTVGEKFGALLQFKRKIIQYKFQIHIYLIKQLILLKFILFRLKICFKLNFLEN